MPGNHYHIDVVEVSTIYTYTDLSKLNCRYLIRPIKSAYVYRSAIKLLQPSKQDLLILHDVLMKNIKNYGKTIPTYKINYLEIALDIFNDYQEIFHRLSKLNKPYAREIMLYRGQESVDCGNRTLYTGTKNNKIAVYMRRSKLNGQWCCHIENRIKTAQNTKKIATDLIRLSNLNIEEYFRVNVFNRLSIKQVNHHHFGKWLADRENKWNGLHGLIYCNIYRLPSFQHLKLHLKEEQKKIMKKRGRKSKWQRKIANLTAYKINKFATELAIKLGFILPIFINLARMPYNNI